MKSTTIILLSCLLTSAFALASAEGQSETQITNATRNSANKGILVGLTYTNFNDSKTTWDFEGTYTDYNGIQHKTYDSGSTYGGTHAGFVGLTAGYRNAYAFGPLGFESTATIYKKMNKSEVSTDMTIYKAQMDALWAMTELVNLSGGFNLAYIDPRLDGVDSEPGLGAEIGAQFNYSQMSFMVGYQSLTWRGKQTTNTSDTSFTSKTNATIGGFLAQIAYIF